jgi:hypothetical protein
MKLTKTFFGKVMVVTGALLILFCMGSVSRAAPPTLDFATYLGGGDSIPFVGGPDWGSPDWGRAVEMDAAGNVYVAGETWSDDLIRPPFIDEFGGFVAKFSPTGDRPRSSSPRQMPQPVRNGLEFSEGLAGLGPDPSPSLQASFQVLFPSSKATYKTGNLVVSSCSRVACFSSIVSLLPTDF